MGEKKYNNKEDLNENGGNYSKILWSTYFFSWMADQSYALDILAGK